MTEDPRAPEDGSLQLEGLQRVQELARSLHDRAGPSPSPLVQEAISELETTVEELSVAILELQEQHDELIQARQLLENERRYWQELFDLAPEAYLLTDVNGMITAANRAAGALFGMPAPDLVGRPLPVYVPPEERTGFRTGLRHVVEQGGRREWSFGIMPRRRTAVLVTAHVVLGRRSGGPDRDLRWQLRDVTDSRQAQVGLQAQFTASREEAETLRELDRWKDAFMAAAAHDLRSPLSIIDTAAQTLTGRDDLDTATRQRLLAAISTHTERLRRLLDDLLDLDRFTRGVVTADREAVAVHDLVADVVRHAQLDDHPVTVDVPHLTADLDRPRVEQIIANLLSNAVRHTPPGTPVHVVVTPFETGIRLVVEDEGPGLDPDLGDQVFHPFVTQARHDDAVRGTGLGLSLVRLFAELHGGTAHAEDRPGGGARMVVELPATVRRDPPASP